MTIAVKSLNKQIHWEKLFRVTGSKEMEQDGNRLECLFYLMLFFSKSDVFITE